MNKIFIVLLLIVIVILVFTILNYTKKVVKSVSSGTSNVTVEETNGNAVISVTGGSGGVSSVSGTIGNITVSNGTTTPVINLESTGTAGTYGYPSSIVTDAKGRVTSVTNGTNPSGTYLPLSGGTMIQGGRSTINMNNSSITNALNVTTIGLTLTDKIVGTGTNSSGSGSSNLYIDEIPAAQPVLPNSAPSTIIQTLVKGYYAENYVYTGSNSMGTPTVNFNVTNSSLALLPIGFYVTVKNSSTAGTGNVTVNVFNTFTSVVLNTTSLAFGIQKYLYWNGTNFYFY